MVYGSGPILKDEEASLEALNLVEGSVAHVEKGPPIKKGEFLVSVFLYDPDLSV